MGEPGPNSFPDIINDKWYKVYADAFQDDFPSACDQALFASDTCCVQGLALNNWFSTGYGCKDGLEICPVTGFSSQRIVGITGPYSNQGDCLAA